MTLRRILAALSMLCALTGALAAGPAHAQKTKAQLNSEIGVSFPDNTSGAITPQILRNVTGDIVNSIMPAAPVVSGNLPSFNGTTGLLKDSGIPAISLTNKPYFILATGQSNLNHAPALSWTPNPNVLRWNNAVNTPNVGTAFAAISNTTVNVIDKLASDLADKMPGRPVYILNVSVSAQPIASWLPGATPIDMYAAILNNMTPAMAAAGVTSIDDFIWWQGESDTANASYVANFATLMTRFFTNSWFPQQTPVLIFGIAPTSISGDSGSDPTNLRLIASGGADPDKRKFVYTGSLSDASYWFDTLHMTAAGYFAAGQMAADVFLNGSIRSNVANVVTNPITGFQSVGRFGPVNSSATFAVSTNSGLQLPTSFPSGVNPIVQEASFDAIYAFRIIDAFGAAVGYTGRRANGTMASPSALALDDTINCLTAQGYGTSAYSSDNRAQFCLRASQAWTNAAHGTYADIWLTPAGSTTMAQYFKFVLGAIQINGTTSGSLTIGPPAVAGASSRITFPAGVTDYSATGGTSQFVKQASVGAALTVAQPAFTDISGTATVAQGGTGVATTAGEQARLNIGVLSACTASVNFNAGNTDTAIPFTMPTGFTRLFPFRVNITNASHTLVTATFGVFSATAAGGTAIVAGGTAITVSATTDGAVNNTQTAGTIGTSSFIAASLATPNTVYFRIGTAEGAAATADVCMDYFVAP